MAKKEQKTKEQKAKAAMAGGSRTKKKKWSKGKSREKALNMVLFDKQSYDRFVQEVPKMKMITLSTVVERLKLSGSLARKALEELESKKLIRRVTKHSRQVIYTRATNA
eukprot:snap_masked-scaffold_9-processed-gene-11.33-mRNA-1 protein AED:0.15 eAED:0.15 QI:0/-1/0/1/-1/1/1/0/108